jgi:hypothetical protein
MGKHEIGFARVERDFYPTPRWVTEALLTHVDLTGLIVWEPATGKGDVAEVLKASGAARVHCTDIASYTYALDGLQDFTIIQPAPRVDAIITNPPQGPRNIMAEAFIAAGLYYIQQGGLLALLLSADFDSAARRRGLFADCPFFAVKLALTRRIVWFERHDGVREAPKENHAWFLWQRPGLKHSALRLPKRAARLVYAPLEAMESPPQSIGAAAAEFKSRRQKETKS